MQRQVEYDTALREYVKTLSEEEQAVYEDELIKLDKVIHGIKTKKTKKVRLKKKRILCLV